MEAPPHGRSGPRPAPETPDDGAAPVRTDRERWTGALILISSAYCAGVSVFVTLPLISLLLERDGTPAWMTGMVLAMFSASVLITGPLLPGVVARFGTMRVILAGVVLSSIGTLLYPLVSGVAAWMAIRFLAGIGLAAHWIVGETWLNTLTADHDRGRMIATYSTLFATGVATGPLVINAVGLDGFLPWFLASALIAVSAVPLLAIRRSAPVLPRTDGGSVSRAVRLVPVLMATGIAAGLCESAAFAMLPVYGVRIGFGEADAGLLLSTFVLGNIALQYPLGILLARLDRRWVLTACAGLAAVIGFLVPLAGNGWLLHPMLFLWGGVLFGFYTIGLMGVGERLPRGMLAAGNAGFVMMYEAGSMVGPVMTGTAMETFGDGSMPITVAAVALPFALLIAWRRLTRPAGPGGGI